MPTKEDTTRPEEEAPATNVKAGFPTGVMASQMPADAPGAQPNQPAEDKEGPSASARGGHTIDDGSEPLPGQPEKDSASSADEVKVVRETTPPKKK